jgi:nucleoside-diphosphate-sugar epimerase
MKIFITGATGFIGKQVLEILKASKHESVCLVRKTNPSIEKLKSDGITVFEGDVRDKSSIMMGMQGCDWVINLANVYAFWVPQCLRLPMWREPEMLWNVPLKLVSPKLSTSVQ